MANLNLDIYTDARAQKKTYAMEWLTVDKFRSKADYKCYPIVWQDHVLTENSMEILCKKSPKIIETS